MGSEETLCWDHPIRTVSPSAAAMSLGQHTSDSAPFFSSDSETEAPGEEPQQEEAESASGVSRIRALLTVFILCYINLLNYMDRFTVAGTDLCSHQT